MSNVLPFHPRASVDFEGSARKQIAAMSKVLVEMAELIEDCDIPDQARERLRNSLRELVCHFEVIEEALDHLEMAAPSLIAEMPPGQHRTFTTANDHKGVEVRFKACTRCQVVYITEIYLGQITVKMQVPKRVRFRRGAAAS